MKFLNYIFLILISTASMTLAQEVNIDGYIYSQTHVEIAEDIFYRHSANCYLSKRPNKFVQHKSQVLKATLDLNNTKLNKFETSDSTSGLFRRKIRSIMLTKKNSQLNNLSIIELQLSDSYGPKRERIFRRDCSHADGLSKPTFVHTKLDMEMTIRMPAHINAIPIMIESSGVFTKAKIELVNANDQTQIQQIGGQLYILTGNPNSDVRLKIKSQFVMINGHDLGKLKISLPSQTEKWLGAINYDQQLSDIIEFISLKGSELNEEQVAFVLSDLFHIIKNKKNHYKNDLTEDSSKLIENINRIHKFQDKMLEDLDAKGSANLYPFIQYYFAVIENIMLDTISKKITQTCYTELNDFQTNFDLLGLYFGKWYYYKFEKSVIDLNQSITNKIDILNQNNSTVYDLSIQKSLNQIIQQRQNLKYHFDLLDGYRNAHDHSDLELRSYLKYFYTFFRESTDMKYDFDDYMKDPSQKESLIQKLKQWAQQLSEVIELNKSNQISLAIQRDQKLNGLNISKLINQQIQFQEKIVGMLSVLGINLNTNGYVVLENLKTLNQCLDLE